nr:DUF4158 domain-containing protein [Carbonactinospora thermoautotrophica]
MRVEPALFAKYAFSGRTIEYHRAQIRRALGFWESTRADEEALTAWLAEEVCGVELVEDRLVEALLVRCRAERVEPPGRIERIVASAQARFEAWFCATTVERLGPATARLDELVAEGGGAGPGLLAQLKTDPDALSLDAVLTEIGKLTAVRARPAGGVVRRCLRAAGRRVAGAGAEDVPVGLPGHRAAVAADAVGGVVLVAAERDHRRAGGAVDRSGPQKVERELTEDLKRVRGKESILFRLDE